MRAHERPWARRAIALVVAAAAGAVAGILVADDDGSVPARDPGAEQQEMRDSLGSRIYESFGGSLAHDEAGCTADQLLDGIGPDRLVELGLGLRNPYDAFRLTELAAEEQHDVVTWLYGCIGDDRLVGYLASAYSGGGQYDFAAAECIAEGQLGLLGPERLRQFAVESSSPIGAPTDALLTPDEQEAMDALDQACTQPPAEGQ